MKPLFRNIPLLFKRIGSLAHKGVYVLAAYAGYQHFNFSDGKVTTMGGQWQGSDPIGVQLFFGKLVDGFAAAAGVLLVGAFVVHFSKEIIDTKFWVKMRNWKLFVKLKQMSVIRELIGAVRKQRIS